MKINECRPIRFITVTVKGRSIQSEIWRTRRIWQRLIREGSDSKVSDEMRLASQQISLKSYYRSRQHGKDANHSVFPLILPMLV
jgi:hypothetical protein